MSSDKKVIANTLSKIKGQGKSVPFFVESFEMIFHPHLFSILLDLYARVKTLKFVTSETKNQKVHLPYFKEMKFVSTIFRGGEE